jgi:hypothetical protein
MMTKHIVSLIRECGTVKTVIVNAMDCKDAELIVSRKYTTCEVIRVTQDESEINYFNKVKAMRKNYSDKEE